MYSSFNWHVIQFGVKVIGNWQASYHSHCNIISPSLSLCKLAACPSYCAAASTGTGSRSAKMGLLPFPNFGHSSHSWLISLGQVINRIGCWKRRSAEKKENYQKIFSWDLSETLSEFILENREMAVASLESGHSAELISFKASKVAISSKFLLNFTLQPHH